jgi:flagellar biosynthesis component FlhA
MSYALALGIVFVFVVFWVNKANSLSFFNSSILIIGIFLLSNNPICNDNKDWSQ